MTDTVNVPSDDRAEIAALVADYGGNAAYDAWKRIEVALEATPKVEQDPVAEIPSEFWKWLEERSLAPDTERDGTVEWLDIISSLNEHENELINTAPASDELLSFPYQRTFNAIADAVKLQAGGISISVEAFKRSFIAQHKGPQ